MDHDKLLKKLRNHGKDLTGPQTKSFLLQHKAHLNRTVGNPEEVLKRMPNSFGTIRKEVREKFKDDFSNVFKTDAVITAVADWAVDAEDPLKTILHAFAYEPQVLQYFEVQFEVDEGDVGDEDVDFQCGSSDSSSVSPVALHSRPQSREPPVGPTLKQISSIIDKNLSKINKIRRSLEVAAAMPSYFQRSIDVIDSKSKTLQGRELGKQIKRVADKEPAVFRDFIHALRLCDVEPFATDLEDEMRSYYFNWAY
mmetsp:Transcript_0/g.1  ORF Transcript_0/g.1 Transcript_0/m.1 type:complete len:253 (+) Transcript_0:128-886(+)